MRTLSESIAPCPNPPPSPVCTLNSSAFPKPEHHVARTLFDAETSPRTRTPTQTQTQSHVTMYSPEQLIGYSTVRKWTMQVQRDAVALSEHLLLHPPRVDDGTEPRVYTDSMCSRGAPVTRLVPRVEIHFPQAVVWALEDAAPGLSRDRFHRACGKEVAACAFGVEEGHLDRTDPRVVASRAKADAVRDTMLAQHADYMYPPDDLSLWPARWASAFGVACGRMVKHAPAGTVEGAAPGSCIGILDAFASGGLTVSSEDGHATLDTMIEGLRASIRGDGEVWEPLEMLSAMSDTLRTVRVFAHAQATLRARPRQPAFCIGAAGTHLTIEWDMAGRPEGASAPLVARSHVSTRRWECAFASTATGQKTMEAFLQPHFSMRNPRGLPQWHVEYLENLSTAVVRGVTAFRSIVPVLVKPLAEVADRGRLSWQGGATGCRRETSGPSFRKAHHLRGVEVIQGDGEAKALDDSNSICARVIAGGAEAVARRRRRVVNRVLRDAQDTHTHVSAVCALGAPLAPVHQRRIDTMLARVDTLRKSPVGNTAKMHVCYARLLSLSVPLEIAGPLCTPRRATGTPTTPRTPATPPTPVSQATARTPAKKRQRGAGAGAGAGTSAGAGAAAPLPDAAQPLTKFHCRVPGAFSRARARVRARGWDAEIHT